MRSLVPRTRDVVLPLVLLAAGCARPPAAQPAARVVEPSARNVVVVLADTLRASNLGAYGHHRDTSPHLAAMAAEGYLFEDARAQAPCTYPSANSLLTGRDGTRFWMQEGLRIGIPEETPSLAEMLAARGWTTIAVSASPIVRDSPSENNRHGGFGRGFDLFDERCLWQDARCVNRSALDYLESVREPFFLYLHYMDPHDPYQPPERRFSSPEYPGKEFIGRGEANPIVEWLFGEPDPGFDVTEADIQHLEALYDDEIAFFDAALGELIDALSSRNLLEETLVAVVADHGEEFLEHRLIKHCNSVYDTEIHTPMVMRIPGLPGNRRIGELVQNLDLVPTVLDYLGIEPPAELDGRSLRPLIEEGVAIHDAVFAAYGSLRAVVTERFKLIADLALDDVRLYDRSSDPGETHDVAARHPDVVRDLEQELVRWIREVERLEDRDEALRRGREAAERLRALGYVQ